MKRASSLNFLNKSVEEPVQVWVGGGPGPRAAGLCVLCPCQASPQVCLHGATFPVSVPGRLWAGHWGDKLGKPSSCLGRHASGSANTVTVEMGRAGGCGPGSGTLAGQTPSPTGQGSTDWQQHEVEPPAPSAHSLEAQASLTAAPSAPAPWTYPDEAPWWTNTEGAAGCQSLLPALPPPPALRMGLLLAPPVSPQDPYLFCLISG